jgi:uncharacterized SAM-binding protein YcdF (DUF218 family)
MQIGSKTAASAHRPFRESVQVPAAEHALVVLGCPVDANGQPRPPLRRRLERALEEAVRDPRALVVVTGGAVESEPEGPAMARWLLRQGLPPGRLVVEDQARYTLENAELVAPLLRRAGVRRVSLITDDFHMGRSQALLASALEAHGAGQVEISPAPARGGPPNTWTVRNLEAAKLLRDRQWQRSRHAALELGVG